MSRWTIPAVVAGMVVWVVPFALAQQRTNPAPETKQARQAAELPRNPRLRTLEGLAEACGPEFHADSLLRLTALASNETGRWKKRAIEDSYLVGGRAMVVYPSVPVPGALPIPFPQ